MRKRPWEIPNSTITGFEDMKDRKAVCKTCHTVMDDFEPNSRRGEFYHKPNFKDGTKNKCVNAGTTFVEGDKEIEPFMRKKERRLQQRNSR
jgi:hypothetical protein